MNTPKLNFKTTNPVWTKLKLSDVVNEIYQGLNTTSDLIYSNKGIPFLQAKHITSGFVNYDGVRFLDAEVYSNVISKYTPKQNDLLFTNRGTIGKVLIMESDADFMIAWNIMLIKIHLSKFNPYLIYLILSEMERKGSFELIQTGNATKFIAKDSLLDININLPLDIGLQSKLSEFFKYLNKKIQLQQEKIDLLKEQKKGFMQKIFSQELRFKGFVEEWKQWKLSELAEIRTGKAFSSLDFNDSGEYLVITNKNIQDEVNDHTSIGDRIDISNQSVLDSYSLSGDNILVTMDGVNIGKVGKFSNDKAVLAQRVGRVNSEQFEFVYQVLSSDDFITEMNKLAVGNAIKHISLKQIADYSFLAPVSKDEQTIIGTFLSGLDKKIQLSKKKLKLLEEHKKALMQQMFI